MFNIFIETPKTIRWLFYTVFIAFFPILIRFIVWLFGNFPNFLCYSITDIYLFSLIIHLSILNEFSHIVDDNLMKWKEKFYILSLVFIFTIMIFLFCAYLNEAEVNFNKPALLGMAIFLAIISFIIGYSVFYKIHCQAPEIPSS